MIKKRFTLISILVAITLSIASFIIWFFLTTHNHSNIRRIIKNNLNYVALNLKKSISTEKKLTYSLKKNPKKTFKRFIPHSLLADNYIKITFNNITYNYGQKDLPSAWIAKWSQTTAIKEGSISIQLSITPTRLFFEARNSKLPLYILIISLFGSIISGFFVYLIYNLQLERQLLRRKSRYLELVYRGTKAVSESKRFTEALANSIEIICKTIGWNAGHAYVINKYSPDELVPTNIWYSESNNAKDFIEATKKKSFMPGEGLPGRVFLSKKPEWIQSLKKNRQGPRVSVCKNVSFHSAIGFPIIVRGKVISVLEFFSESKLKKDDELLKQFQIVGLQIGEVWKKKEAESNLEKSEQRANLILESTADGIYGLDKDGKTTFVNKAAKQMLGYCDSELIGESMHQLIHYAYEDGTIYPKENCPIFQACISGGEVKNKKEILWRKNNSSFPVEYSSTPIYFQDDLIGAVVTFTDITQKLNTEKYLTKIAKYDFLTSLPNRYLFDETLLKTQSYCERKKEKFSLIMMDLDGFKNVNDTHGHDVGDRLLQEVSKRITTLIRKHDFIARLGGDEFVFLLSDFNKNEDLALFCNKIINHIREPYNISNTTIHIGTSLGVAIFPDDSEELKPLIKYADIALYEAKNSGKNRVCFYHDSTRSIQ